MRGGSATHNGKRTLMEARPLSSAPRTALRCKAKKPHYALQVQYVRSYAAEINISERIFPRPARNRVHLRRRERRGEGGDALDKFVLSREYVQVCPTEVRSQNALYLTRLLEIIGECCQVNKPVSAQPLQSYSDEEATSL